MIGKQGKDLISIPVPQIEIPRFRYGARGNGGVGQGEGEIGAVLGPGEGESGGEAGNAPGQHLLEVDVSPDEPAQMLGGELEPPRLEARRKRHIHEEEERYTGM